MNKIEKIRRKIEALLNDWKYVSSTEATYRCEVYKELLDDIDNLEAESVSEDFEAEMQRYYVDWDEHPQYTQTARHFARWQKEQMMKNAVGGLWIRRNKYTKQNVLQGFDVTHDVFQKFKDGDKVKIIVIKEG